MNRCAASEDKKCRVDAFALQQVEKLGSQCAVRPVVKGQRDNLACGMHRVEEAGALARRGFGQGLGVLGRGWFLRVRQFRRNRVGGNGRGLSRACLKRRWRRRIL